ncbi:MAG: hypothetical protein K9L21_02635, partial [Spirochaetia bacterium]|nr:hypothetical protein [Spirochaetia bacterium]
MKRFSKVLLSLLTAALILIMVTACATQQPPEVDVQEVEDEQQVREDVEDVAGAEAEAAAKAQAEAEAAAKAQAEAEAAAKAQAEAEAAAKAQAEAEAAAKAQAEAEAAAKVEIYRIIGTNGLLNLALASYEGGMGFTEVS